MTQNSICAIVLAVTVSLGQPAIARASLIERTGDVLQVALPVAAMVCSFGLRDLRNFLLRYGANMVVTHGSKNLLGDAAINLRPSGSDRGFPSGHTTAAFQGASYLIRDCVGKTPWGRTALLGAAVFVGGSRIEAGAHFLFQVLAGAILGTLSDRLFRRKRSTSGEPNTLRRVAGKIRERILSRSTGSA